MKKVVFLIQLCSVLSFSIYSQEYPVLQGTNKVNNSPWYGLGLSTVKVGNSSNNAVQLAGYYGLYFKTKLGDLGLDESGNIGIGTVYPQSRLHLSVGTGTAHYPTITGKGDVIQFLESGNNAIEIGSADALNARKSWILARHHNANSFGKYFSTLHLQPDVGDKSQYRGVAIGYKTDTTVPIGTHLAVNGKVGIGTDDPKEKLDVQGNVLLNSANANSSNSLINSSSLIFKSSGYATDNRTRYQQWQVLSKTKNVWGSGDLVFNSNTDGSGFEERVRFSANGSVGIGTSNPFGKLQVKDLNTAPVLNITGKSPNTGNDELISELRLSNLYDNLSGHRASIKAISDKAGSHGNVAFQFTTSIWNGQHTEVNAMRIASNGNVGIGTSDPKGYKLAVAGKAIAEEIKVKLQTSWPDYVFTDTYNLPTLQEVEQHITEKGHLINIPSAEKVAEEGIYLGEMNAKLLEKIEELTLYTIQQEKEIKKQEEKINQQQKEIDQLKDQNTRLTQLEEKLNNFINTTHE